MPGMELGLSNNDHTMSFLFCICAEQDRPRRLFIYSVPSEIEEMGWVASRQVSTINGEWPREGRGGEGEASGKFF